MLQTKKRFHRGFTVVELAVIIAVIGILATIGAVSYSSYTKRAAQKEAEADLGQAAMQLEKYKANNGGYPATQDEVDGGNGLPKSSADRTYDYRVGGGAYCLSTSAPRTGKAYRIENGTSKSVEGNCSAFTANALQPLSFINTGDDGIMTWSYWSWPPGTAGNEDYRVVVVCPLHQRTLLKSSPPSAVTMGNDSFFSWVNQWESEIGCSMPEATLRIAYTKGGQWSPDLVVTPAMMDIY